jgi:hypothetical protein
MTLRYRFVARQILIRIVSAFFTYSQAEIAAPQEKKFSINRLSLTARILLRPKVEFSSSHLHLEVAPMYRQMKELLLATCVAACALVSASAQAAYIVPGNANPNLAGREAGYLCCSGDSAPAQSPLQVTGLTWSAGDVFEFTVSGRVSFTPSVPPGNNPDGDSSGSMTNYGDGISAPTSVRFNALYGIFLTDASPTGQPTPSQLSFASGLNFTDLAPGLGQIFFIGDGLTSDSNAGDFSGTRQGFLAPSGATRLFLATGDGFGWFNNSGSFNVDIAIRRKDVPVPPTAALLLLGLLGMGIARKRG